MAKTCLVACQYNLQFFFNVGVLPHPKKLFHFTMQGEQAYLIDCIFMDQAGSGDEFLELGHKWCMGIVYDVTSQYDI